jgi:hypothetical protein
MQIHEITKTQLDEGVGSFLGGLAGGISAGASALGQAVSPVGDFKSAMADPKRQQQIKMLADKVYRGWKAYEKTLLQSNPDARETGMYEQALLAFVVKNLLSGQYLPNVINKDKITTLVKQLSSSSGITEADAATASEKTPGAPPTPPAAPLTPQKEKDLWLQLAQQAAVATSQAPGTGSKPNNPKDPSDPDDTTIGDARHYSQQFPVTDAVKSWTSSFTTASNSATGGVNVRSTGNPVADGLLLAAGFRGL